MIAYVNGQYLNETEASLGISDLALLRGYGVFDFFRICRERTLFVEDHLNRLCRSASALNLGPLPSRDEFLDIIHELNRLNAKPEGGIRINITGGYSKNGYSPGIPNIFITQIALAMPSREAYEKGIKIITHEHQRELPDVKSINYLTGIWLQEKIRAAGADDVLYHVQGLISECPRSNFFILDKKGILRTPAAGILHGITRKNVLKIASENMQVLEGPVSLQDIRVAQEAFISSSSRRVMAVVEMDGHKLGNGKPGPTTMHLLDKLIKMEESAENEYGK